MSEDDRIRSIVVAGGGIVGLSAALAFARALPDARVEVLDLPADPAALADRLPGTLPEVQVFHRLLGIGEPELVREAGTTYRTGTRFENWSANGQPWLHCFGRHGMQMQSSPFHHQWARLQRQGKVRPFHAYAPVAALAAQDKFVHPQKDARSLLSSYDYALRIDPRPYRELLLRHAIAQGISFRGASLAGVEQGADGSISGLLIQDGTRLEADLFIDCAGPSAPLLSAVGDGFEDWSEYLPCDRLFLGEAPARSPSPLDVAIAAPWGWHWRSPLSARTSIGAAYLSAHSDEEVAANLSATAGGAQLDPVTLRPGRRANAWVANVVAFGDAAVAVDPLESTNLYLAQSAIGRAVTLIPPRRPTPLLLQEYNRRTRIETERVRDFIALHYLEAAVEGPFWHAARQRRKPESLAHTLEQFEGRGRIPDYEEETFRKDSWLAVLFGLGVTPARIDPTAHRIPLEESEAALRRLVQQSEALPAQLPSYAEYLDALIQG
jgi:tryptophan halogenase